MLLRKQYIPELGDDFYTISNGSDICTSVLDLLEDVTYAGNDIEVVEAYCFQNVNRLKAIRLPKTVFYIGEYAFYSCSVEEIILPDNLEQISPWTFAYCNKLTTINFPVNLKEIPAYAFYDCEKFKHLGLSNLTSLKTLGPKAFAHCHSLEVVKLPSNLEVIENSAFRWCYNLKVINLPDTLRFIGEDCFTMCDDITCVVTENSYAHNYCLKNKLKVVLKNDSNDRL